MNNKSNSISTDLLKINLKDLLDLNKAIINIPLVKKFIQKNWIEDTLSQKFNDIEKNFDLVYLKQ